MSEKDTPEKEPELTAEDFIKSLDKNPIRANQIHDELWRLTTALVKQKLALYFGSYTEGDVTENVNETLLIVYSNFASGKQLDFSKPPDSLQSYFWRIADNLCKNYRRGKAKSSKLDSISELDSDGREKIEVVTSSNPETKMSEAEQAKIHQNCQNYALNKLEKNEPKDYLLLISYYSHENKPTKEKKAHREKMAQDLGIEQPALTLIIHRIKKEVRRDYRKCLIQQK